MGSKKKKSTFVYKGCDARARIVSYELEILDMMIELGFQPARSDLADVLGRHMALQPARFSPNVESLVVRFLRKGPQGSRNVTIDTFLERYEKAVLEAETLQRSLKEKREKAPYDSANAKIARKYGMRTKRLEKLRTTYRRRFPLDPADEMPSEPQATP